MWPQTSYSSSFLSGDQHTDDQHHVHKQLDEQTDADHHDVVQANDKTASLDINDTPSDVT